MQAITIVTMLALAATAALAGHIEDHHHHSAPYKFAYEVHDPHHGDVKSQHESGHGGQVKGFYSLVEPDGHVRKVEYTADKHNGFQAVVTREGKTTHHGYGDLDGNGLGAGHGAGYGAGIGAGAGYGAGHGAGYGAGIGAGYGAGIGAGVGAGAGAGHGHLKGLPGVHGGNGAGYGAGYGAGLDAGHGHHGHGY